MTVLTVGEGIQNVSRALSGLNYGKGNSGSMLITGERKQDYLEDSPIIKNETYSSDDFIAGPLDKEGKRKERTRMMKEIYGLSHGKGKRKKRKKK